MPAGLILALGIPWLAAVGVRFWRFRAKERAYLRRFPAVDGVPLDRLWYIGVVPWSAPAQAALIALWEQQADPELESQRREVWRYSRFSILWFVVFPLLVVAAVRLVILSGHLP